MMTRSPSELESEADDGGGGWGLMRTWSLSVYSVRCGGMAGRMERGLEMLLEGIAAMALLGGEYEDEKGKGKVDRRWGGRE